MSVQQQTKTWHYRRRSPFMGYKTTFLIFAGRNTTPTTTLLRQQKKSIHRVKSRSQFRFEPELRLAFSGEFRPIELSVRLLGPCERVSSIAVGTPWTSPIMLLVLGSAGGQLQRMERHRSRSPASQSASHPAVRALVSMLFGRLSIAGPRKTELPPAWSLTLYVCVTR